MATETRPDTSPLRIALAVVVVLGVLGFFSVQYLNNQAVAQNATPALTDEAKAYTKYLKLGEVQMVENTNWMKSRVIEITGKVTNGGDHPVTSASIYCIFYDPSQQPLYRERVNVVKPGSTPLAPGATRAFRLPFDAIPERWNQTMPQMVIAQITF